MWCKLLTSLATSIAAASAPAGARDNARDFPQRPIRFVIPYAPGGATDIVARLIGPKMTEILNQQIVIDNRVGASGNIALELVAKSSADGYTLLVGNISTNSINPVGFSKTLKFDPAKELSGITLMASVPNALVAGAGFPPNTLKDAIAYSRARPGQLNHGGPIGSYAHLDLLALLNATGMRMLHVPSKGGAGTAITTLVNGEIHLTWMNMATALPQIKAGRFKAYAVSTNQRLPALPNVPTMTEEGYAGIGSNNWNGLFAPARVPKLVVDRLFSTLTAVLNRPDVQEAFAKNQIPIAVSQSPQEFNTFVQAEMRRWARILKENPVTFE